MTTLIPKVSKAIEKAHTGESAAIVNGKFVAFGKNSYEAGQKALKKGYAEEDIMIAYITGSTPCIFTRGLRMKSQNHKMTTSKT